MQQLYLLFNPIDGNERLEQRKLSNKEIDTRELNFLEHFFKVCQFLTFKNFNHVFKVYLVNIKGNEETLFIGYSIFISLI